MENNNGNFLDKNTVMAIGFSILFFVGWQFYIQKKYPDAGKDNQKIAQEKTVNKAQPTTNEVSSETVSPQTEEILVNEAGEKKAEALTRFENMNYNLNLTNYGMGLKDIQLKTYSDRENNPIVFENNGKSNFATYYKNQPIIFEIGKEGSNIFVGRGQTSDFDIIKRVEFNDSLYNAKVSVQVQWKTTQRTEPIETIMGNKAMEISSSLFLPAYDGTEFFVINEGSEERERIDIEKKQAAQFSQSTLTSIGSQYFTLAALDHSDVIPSSHVKYNPETQLAEASIQHKSVDNKESFQYEYLAYMGPKKYDVLKSVDNDLSRMINYGIFSVLSHPMLSMLKWLYGLFSNWGLAIIFLTIFIRIVLLPINISSFKSMKKMQKIQPQLKALKERYKDDPQRMNQETMALMKREKANPIGGCLPMLLQLPVFFALYSVLGQSVELYKSPFILWIKDLSYQDPFYVLPIAVGALYFLQMSLTPQTGMDPAQQRVMKFIPLLFCFFMITVPSGLTLYFFVNTVFGIGQQLIFQRERRKAAA